MISNGGYSVIDSDEIDERQLLLLSALALRKSPKVRFWALNPCLTLLEGSLSMSSISMNL